MGKRVILKSVLGVVALLAMVGVGWLAAKLAGPSGAAQPAASATQPETGTGGFFARLFGPDLSHLKAWEGGYAFDVKEGRNLLADEKFNKALKKTLGNEIYDKFSEEVKRSKKLLSVPITNEDGVLRVDLSNLAGYTTFNMSVFVDTKESTLDVCWYEDEPQKESGPDMILHTGERFTLGSGYRMCEDFPFKSIATKAAYASTVQAEQSPLLGTWSGTFPDHQGRAQFTVTRSMTISGDPSVPGGLRFKQTEHVQMHNGSFNCVNSSTLDLTYEGPVKMDGNMVSCSPSSYSNPACGRPSFYYQLKNRELVRNNGMFGDKPMNGGSQRLRKVN